jgi:hypothetical protein
MPEEPTMLTRTGSPPGPGWMRRLGARCAGNPTDPRTSSRHWRWLAAVWVVWTALMLLGPGLGRVTARAPLRSYESPLHVMGMPLFAYGERAHGLIAVGGVATGGLAVGGIAVGVIAVGGLAAGGLALGGITAGVGVLAGLAVGYCAMGGAALGYYALGGLAVGGYAYAGGGVAVGYHEAQGGQSERLVG